METEAFKVFDMLLSVIVPIGIMVAGWRYVSLQKWKEHTAGLEDQLDNTEMTNIKNQLKNIEEIVTSNEAAMEDMRTTIKEIQQVQAQIAESNRVNGRCTHELATLVMALSEGLRDNHLDGNITAAVNRYKRFESDTLGQIMIGQ